MTASAPALTWADAVGFDPLRDRSYRNAKTGPDVVAWLAWLELGSKADKTIDGYERNVATLPRMYPRLRLEEVTDVEAAHVVASWPKKSRRVRKAALNQFFKWAVRTRRIERNPLDLLPDIRRTPQKWIDVFSDSEIEDLYALPHADSFLMRLLFEAGPRKSEARALQVRRLKLAPPPPHLAIVAGKGGKDRVVPMSAPLLEAAREFLLLERLDPLDHLWYTRPGGGREISRGRAMGEASFDRWWRRCLTGAGVRYRNPHVARHTFATRWLRRGGRITTLSVVMGHTSLKTTFDLYGHLDTRDVVADLALIDAVGINPE